MRSLLSGNSLVPLCSSPLQLALGKKVSRVLWAFCLTTAFANAQSVRPNPVVKTDPPHRANEFTLAGLRPGRDTVSRATSLYRKADDHSDSQNSQVSWTDKCRHEKLVLDYDSERKVQVIRVISASEREASACAPPPGLSSWKTGLGLRTDDSTQKLLKLYGAPDSKSPSTRDGQPLELWYYAFDWAGPDVPQVMEVLCTREKDGQPGRVVEITLAAPSL
jgi:hypothetical protein